MNGPDHFHEAERLAEEAILIRLPEPERARDIVAAGQLHATLALAAATALQAALPLIGDDEQITEWAKAVGFTFTTPDLVRIDDALALLDQLGDEGLLVPAAAERLRQVLRRRNEGQATAATGEPSTESVEELSTLIYESGVIDDSLSAAGSAEKLADALLKAGVRLPASISDGGVS